MATKYEIEPRPIFYVSSRRAPTAMKLYRCPSSLRGTYLSLDRPFEISQILATASTEYHPTAKHVPHHMPQLLALKNVRRHIHEQLGSCSHVPRIAPTHNVTAQPLCTVVASFSLHVWSCPHNSALSRHKSIHLTPHSGYLEADLFPLVPATLVLFTGMP